MKIGARVLKTGLAITLSILASLWIIPGSDGMLAGIGAAYSTQPSVKKSFETFISRVAANALGGVVAVLMAWLLGTTPVAIGISAVLTIAILNALKLGEVIGLAVVTLIVVMLGQGDTYDYTYAAIIRVSETLIGVLITFLVNWLIYPPKYDAKFYHTLEYTMTETLMWLRASLRKNTEYSVMERDIKWSQRQVYQLNNLFELMRFEMFFSAQQRQVQRRQNVVYRHMVHTLQSAIQLLIVLHRNEKIFQAFPDDMRVMIRDRIETLASAHEQIILKFNGKVPPREVNFMTMNAASRYEYMQRFFEQARIQEEQQVAHHFEGNGVIHILSAIYQYEENLSNLNKVVRSFKLRGTQKSQTFQMNGLG